MEPLDGIEHLPAQPQAHKHGEAHAHQGAAHRHRGEQAPGIPVQCLGPLEDGVQPHLLLKGRPIGVLLPLLAQLLPRQQLLPQLDSQAAGQGGLAGVDGPPVPVEEQQVALSAVGPLQQSLEVRPGQGDDQIACVLPRLTGDPGRPPKQGRAVPLPAVHLCEGQPDALPGGVENAPLGGHHRLHRAAAGGVHPDPVPVIQVELGAETAALGGAVQLAIDGSAVPLSPGECRGHIGACLKGQGCLLKAPVQAVQGAYHVVQLLPGLLLQLAVQPQAEDLEQHGRAQQQRQQGGQQEPREQPSVEGMAFFHGSSPPPR